MQRKKDNVFFVSEMIAFEFVKLIFPIVKRILVIERQTVLKFEIFLRETFSN